MPGMSDEHIRMGPAYGKLGRECGEMIVEKFANRAKPAVRRMAKRYSAPKFIPHCIMLLFILFLAVANGAHAEPIDTCFSTTWTSSYHKAFTNFNTNNYQQTFAVTILVSPEVGQVGCNKYIESDLTQVQTTITFTTLPLGGQLAGNETVNGIDSIEGKVGSIVFNNGMASTISYNLDDIDFVLPNASVEFHFSLGAEGIVRPAAAAEAAFPQTRHPPSRAVSRFRALYA